MAVRVVKVRTPILLTNLRLSSRHACQGFTLIEMMVVIMVVGVLFAVTIPSLSKFNESVSYHDAVRQLVLNLGKARRMSAASGQPVDLLIDTQQRAYLLTKNPRTADFGSAIRLPENLTLDVSYARDISPDGRLAAVRFYPQGGTSGGEIVLTRPSGGGVRLVIDWLMAAVSQRPL